MKSGDRVKTDRRDAVMLAKLHRAGELTRSGSRTRRMKPYVTWCGRGRRRAGLLSRAPPASAKLLAAPRPDLSRGSGLGTGALLPQHSRRPLGSRPPKDIRHRPKIIDLYRGFFRQIGSTGAPSMLFDIENNRQTEAEHIFGDLVRSADRLGVEAPILRAALCNLQIYDARRQSRS
jgi:hypothetical protein